MVAFAHNPNSSQLSVERIERLVERHQLVAKLTRLCDLSGISLWVVTETDRALLLTSDQAPGYPTTGPRVSTPIRVHDETYAEVVAAGRSDAYWAASLMASWLEVLVMLGNEIDSLTSEVVHSYEELHLLYDLGTSLGGVVDPDVACELVVKEILGPVGALDARLLLLQHGTERVVAHAVTPVASEAIEGQLAEASAILAVNGERIGSLAIKGKLAAADFRSEDLKLLAGVAAVAAPAIRNAQLYQAAKLRADTDVLTGVWNHRRIQERIDEELERSRRHGHLLSTMIVEIDQLQLFHDLYGQVVGNEVLQLAADCLRATARQTDIIGLYGAEKFIVVLPETHAAGALELAQRVLAAMRMREVAVDGARLSVAFSMGIATFPDDAITKHALIGQANSALEEAKASGGGTARCFAVTELDVPSGASETFSVLEGLVRAVDVKDHYTLEHSEVVMEAALLLAARLNLPEKVCEALRIAGALHDIGKIAIPDRVLKKPGKLTAEEFNIMKQHVVLSEAIVRGVPQVDGVLDAVAHHHERYDGKGYPYGKCREDIPLLGRIMAIADAYSAMCMDRPYRKGLTWLEIRPELERGAGTQFDPVLVPLFIEAMEQQYACIATLQPHTILS